MHESKNRSTPRLCFALFLLGSVVANCKPARAEYSMLGLFDRSTASNASSGVDSQASQLPSVGSNLSGFGFHRAFLSTSQQGAGGLTASSRGSGSTVGTGASRVDLLSLTSSGTPSASDVGNIAGPLATPLSTQQATTDSQNGAAGISPPGLAGGGGSSGALFDTKHSPSPLNSPVTGGGSTGAPASPLVVDSKGNIFGTTTTGDQGSPSGSIFSFSSQSGALRNLAPLDPALGTLTSLALDPAGNLFALSSGGGTGNAGLLVELKKGTGQFQTLLDLGKGGQGIASILSVNSQGDVQGVTATGATVELTTQTGLASNPNAPDASPKAALGVPGHRYGVVPEIDPLAAQSGLTLLLGGLLIAADNRARQRRSTRLLRGV